MKKLLVIVLALILAVVAFSCAKDENAGEPEVVALTYAEYMAAELESEVVVEAYVQGKQSWWENKATVYAQDENGGYFFYDMACSEEDYAKLEVGTKIRVTGYKGEWAGEIEVMDATFEILEAEPFVAVAEDLTAVLGTDELINHQNKLAAFKGLTVVAVEYKNGEPGDDIYVTLSDGTNEYSFCVEVYLTGLDTEVYKTVGTLNAGDVVDVEGFLYWYEGVNTHITSVTVVEEAVEEVAEEVAEEVVEETVEEVAEETVEEAVEETVEEATEVVAEETVEETVEETTEEVAEETAE